MPELDLRVVGKLWANLVSRQFGGLLGSARAVPGNLRVRRIALSKIAANPIGRESFVSCTAQA